MVIVTSVSGSSSRPNDFEYAVAMAFFRRGRPYMNHQHSAPPFVCPKNGLYLCRRILITINLVKRFLGSIECEFRWVVATKSYKTQTLTLYHRIGERRESYKNPCPMFTIGCTGEAAAASLTMDLTRTTTYQRNAHKSDILCRKTYQTSCRCPATLAAGRKGSAFAAVVDMLRWWWLRRGEDGIG